MKKVKTPIKAAEKKIMLSQLAQLTAHRLWEKSGLSDRMIAAVAELYEATYPTAEDKAALQHLIQRNFIPALEEVNLVSIAYKWRGEYGSAFRAKWETWVEIMSRYCSHWDINFGVLPVKIHNSQYPSDLLSVSSRRNPDEFETISRGLNEQAQKVFADIDYIASQFAVMAEAISRCRTVEQIAELSPDLEELARSCASSAPAALPVKADGVRSFLNTIKPLNVVK